MLRVIFSVFLITCFILSSGCQASSVGLTAGGNPNTGEINGGVEITFKEQEKERKRAAAEAARQAKRDLEAQRKAAEKEYASQKKALNRSIIDGSPSVKSTFARAFERTFEFLRPKTACKACQ